LVEQAGFLRLGLVEAVAARVGFEEQHQQSL